MLIQRSKSMHMAKRGFSKKSTMIIGQVQDESVQMDEEEKQEVINLNYFKAKKEKNYNLNQMLQQGKLQENEVDHNPHFPSPTINTKLIHNIFQISYSEQKEPIQKKLRLESIELIQKNTNQKLVNQILFNKMKKKKTVSQHELNNSTSNVLQSFKSLTQMFRSVNQIVDYHQVAILLRQSKAQFCISRETDRNLDRQQYNFNYIVEGRINQLKLQSNDIEIYSSKLQKLRIENCTLREQILQISQEISLIKHKYEKQRQNVAHSEDKIHFTKNWDKQQYISQINDNERIELKRLQTLFDNLKQSLEINTDDLKKQQILLHDLKHTKKICKQDLAEFLKQVLQSEEIQISSSLVQIIKLLISIKESVSQADFPSFLDPQSRDFLLQKSNLELSNEQAKTISSRSKVIMTPHINVSGNRVQYQQKLEEVMNSIRTMKKQRYSQSQQAQSETSPIMEMETFAKQQQSFQQSQSFENQINDLEIQELERLSYIYQGKQLPNSLLVKLIRTIQAEFGFKQMHQKLQLVIQNYDPITQQQSKQNQKQKVTFK